MMKLSPIVISLLDTDLYKFTMNQVMFHKHTNLNGTYIFKCRNKDIVFTEEMVKEINAQIDHLCTLTFTDEELNYLGSLRFIKPDYVEFLRLWRPLRRYVKCSRELDGTINLRVDGPIFSVMQFEIYLLEIVNEVYFRMQYDYLDLVATDSSHKCKAYALISACRLYYDSVGIYKSSVFRIQNHIVGGTGLYRAADVKSFEFHQYFRTILIDHVLKSYYRRVSHRL